MSYPPGAYPPQQPYPVGQSPYVQQTQKGYPNGQPAAYAYPMQQPGMPPAQSPYGAQPPVSYGNPPPPYTPYGPAHTSSYYPSMGNPAYPSQAGMAVGNFDPGARFGPTSSHNIPPPPPGHCPTQAQLAAQQGQGVVMTHRREDWLSGAPGGGYTFW